MEQKKKLIIGVVLGTILLVAIVLGATTNFFGAMTFNFGSKTGLDVNQVSDTVMTTVDVDLDVDIIPTMLSDLELSDIGNLSESDLAGIATDSKIVAAITESYAEAVMNNASDAASDEDSTTLADEQERAQNWANTADKYADNAEGATEILSSRVDTYEEAYNDPANTLSESEIESLEEGHDDAYIEWNTIFMEFIAYMATGTYNSYDDGYYECLVDWWDKNEFVTSDQMATCYTSYGTSYVAEPAEWTALEMATSVAATVVETYEDILEPDSLEEGHDDAYIEWNTIFMEFIAYMATGTYNSYDDGYYECLVDWWDKNEFVTSDQMATCYTSYGTSYSGWGVAEPSEWTALEMATSVAADIVEEYEHLLAIKDDAQDAYDQASTYLETAQDATDDARIHANNAQAYADSAAEYEISETCRGNWDFCQ